MNPVTCLIRKARQQLRASLSLHAMFAVLVIIGCVSVLALFISYLTVRDKERERFYADLDMLMIVVQRSATAAVLQRDALLAEHVAQGLLAIPAVTNVSIRAGDTLLAEHQRPDAIGIHAGTSRTLNLSSPRHPEVSIGTLEVWTLDSRVEEIASDAARYIAALLALKLLLTAATVGWLVFTRITSPISLLAQRVSRSRLESSGLIWPPVGNEHDEIGQLTRDINLMIVRNRGLLLDERALREDIEASERKFRLIFENAETGIFTLDANLTLLKWNPALERIFGAEALASQPPALADLLDCPPEQLVALSDQSSQTAGTAGADFELPGQLGRHVHIVLTRANAHTMLGVCNDISERKQAEARAHALAERDPLTGLYNRRGFHYRASHVLAQVSQEQGAALLMLDLDGFKALNDTRGHDAGDAALRLVARLLEGCVRKHDLLARLGGDEFVVLLDGLREPQPAQQVADKILQAIATLQSPDTHDISLGASIGIAMSLGPEEQIDALMRRADQAMYAVKRSGKHNWQFANDQ